MTEAIVIQKIKIGKARRDIGVTQDELARRAGLARKSVHNAEQGEPVLRITARAILRALNEERVSRGMTPLEMEELDVKIRGDTEK